MAINTVKTLTLTLDGDSVECQLTRAALVDNPDTEELSTFCGTETSAIANYDLEISGFQDYAAAESLFETLHTAYVADPIAEIDFVLEVGGKTRSGTCKPTSDVPFGGDAGTALTGDVTLDVVSAITDGVAA